MTAFSLNTSGTAPTATAAWSSVDAIFTTMDNSVTGALGAAIFSAEVPTAGASWTGTKTATYHDGDYQGTTNSTISIKLP